MAPLEKTKKIIGKLPEHKQHLDFLAALISIPVLITVLLINLSNINNKKAETQPTPTPTSTTKTTNPTVKTVVITSPPNQTTNPESCIKGIGQVDVSYPQEGQVVGDNPLCIQIDYTQGNNCSAVWAYKINSGTYSDYSNNSVCLYNIPSGDNTFTLQVKSLVNSDTKIIERHFGYKATTQPSTTPGAASQSANLR